MRACNLKKQFHPEDVFGKRKVLEVMSRAEKLNEWVYRVLNLVCGHESIITHATFRRTRSGGSSGLCNSCQSIKSYQARPNSKAGRKPKRISADSETSGELPDKETPEQEAMRIFNAGVRPQIA